ncbi:MAG: superoxide dismutase family protein [Clostridiaceae bacterium]|nr:superoxide dismutase family protein [Clostridiaceae bacterium]
MQRDSGGAFSNALSHYDPGSCPHPYHAGDLPPLFGNSGYAFQVFFTDRFSVREILGKTVIIHANPDDFTTQPAGKAGQRIACGEIRAFGRW